MRPIVLVYQEFAAVSATPDIPDLNCLLVGPAYWIKDYLDDKSDIQTASDYGTQNSDNPYTPPQVGTDALTVAEPPGNKTGAYLDATSVTVYFDAARVEISKDAATGAGVVADTNVVTGAGGTTFITDGVKAGDIWKFNVAGYDFSVYRRRVLQFTSADNNTLGYAEYEIYPEMIFMPAR